MVVFSHLSRNFKLKMRLFLNVCQSTEDDLIGQREEEIDIRNISRMTSDEPVSYCAGLTLTSYAEISIYSEV